MFHQFSDKPYARIGRMVRTLLSAVLFSLVVTVSARAALLHNQYYFDGPIPTGEVGGEVPGDGLVGQGTFELFSELTGSCGNANAGVDCANYFNFAMENFGLVIGDPLIAGATYDPANSFRVAIGATWAVFSDWSLFLDLTFIDPFTGALNTLLLLPGNLGVMPPNSAGFCSDLAGYAGLCNTGQFGQSVGNLTVLSMPVHKVPEPSTLALFAIALAGLGFFMTRRRRVV